jgi:hypothetical protein
MLSTCCLCWNRPFSRSFNSDLEYGTSYRHETLRFVLLVTLHRLYVCWQHSLFSSIYACSVGNRNLFLELLPLVGSHDSILLVRDLVVNGILKNDTAVQLLSSFPFSIRKQSEQLLTDLEVIGNNSDTCHYVVLVRR